MISTVYVEEAIKTHPRTREILSRFPGAVSVPISRYGEIFNRKAQNFRLQKIQPAVILAEKFENFVLEVPEGYGIGGHENYYFSHMLNCIYDCRYCFLQGMYRSANYVIFINYEDFQRAIETKVKEASGKELYFFSGYDCDSLALEPVTHFASSFIPFFAKYPNVWFELRTKSVQIASLLKMKPVSNCIVAFSLSPEPVVSSLEDKTPALEQRLEAIERLADSGWKLGLRFDPLIYHESYQETYRKLFEKIFVKLNPNQIHSVSLGAFRLPKDVYENMFRLYPDEKLFSGPLEERNGMTSYSKEFEEEMLGSIREMLEGYISRGLLFPCAV